MKNTPLLGALLVALLTGLGSWWVLRPAARSRGPGAEIGSEAGLELPIEAAEVPVSHRMVASEVGGEADPIDAGAERVAVHGSIGLQPGGWPRSLAGAALRFHAVGHGGRTLRRVPVTDGTWEGLLAPGEWRVAGRLGGQALTFAPEIIRVAPGGGVVPRIQVRAAPAVRGRLVDCLGVPIAGVAVGLQGERQKKHGLETTGADGLFVIKAREGLPWTVLVDEASLPPGVGTPWWQGIGDGGVVGSEHRLPSIVGGEVLDIVLYSPGLVNGRAVDDRGEPLRGVTLSIRMKPDLEQPARGANYVVRTDDAGAFESRLPAARYEARLYPPGTRDRSVRPEPTIFEVGCFAHELPLTIAFEQGLGVHTLTVAVVDLEHRSHAGVPLVLHAVQPGLTLENRSEYHAKGWGRSNVRGRLSFEGLPVGRYLLSRAEGPTVDSDLVFADLQDRLLIDLDGSALEYAWKVEPFAPGRLEITVAPDAFTSWPVNLRLEIGDRSVALGQPIVEAGVFSFERLLPGIGELTITERGEDEDPVITSRPVTILPGETARVELP